MEADERPSKIRKTEDTGRSQLNNDDEEILFQRPTSTSTEDEVTSAVAPCAPNDELSSHTEEPIPDEKPMSKNALKRLRRQREWEAGHDLRKQKRKEKQAEKRERKKLEKTESAALVASGEIQPEAAESAKPPIQPVGIPLTILVDCDFDEQMTDKEIVSIASQITRCYSENRRAMYRPILALSSFNGRLKTRFETALKSAHTRWSNIQLDEAGFAEVAQKAKSWMLDVSGPGSKDCPALASHAGDPPEDGEIIYLTADSDETLDELRPHSIYIIGGIVDRNRHKGICYKRAKDMGMRTAKLPIGKFMQMESRAVLTTNHVCEIMLRWLELKDWGEAFMRVIPKRKGGLLRNAGELGESKEVGFEYSDDAEEHDSSPPAETSPSQG